MIEHFYKSIHGCFTFPDFYAFVADGRREANAGGWHGVEVGALDGQSAACLAIELAARDWVKLPFRLDLVELSANASKIRANLGPVAAVLGAIHSPCSSVEASRNYADDSLDFVMLDADHTLQSVRDDIAHWWPKVRGGGILSGHDFSHYFPGVMRAALEAFPRLNVWRGSPWPDDSVGEPQRSEAERDLRARSAHGGSDDFHSVWWVRK
jgi:hypothetical protein